MRLGFRGMVMAALACAAVAACRDQGGELRDVTDRRRAELANRDTTQDHRPADDTADAAPRLPAFAGDTAARTTATTPATSATVDSARRPEATGWAATPRSGGTSGGTATLRGFRAAANPEGFDRLVLDFGTDAVPAWTAQYASRPVLRCGSGEPAQVQGERWLRIRLRGTQAHDDAGQPTVRQRQLPLNMAAMREMAITCDFEGEVEVVVGVSAANPYRVLQLANPSRLAIDVQRQP